MMWYSFRFVFFVRNLNKVYNQYLLVSSVCFDPPWFGACGCVNMSTCKQSSEYLLKTVLEFSCNLPWPDFLLSVWFVLNYEWGAYMLVPETVKGGQIVQWVIGECSVSVILVYIWSRLVEPSMECWACGKLTRLRFPATMELPPDEDPAACRWLSIAGGM